MKKLRLKTVEDILYFAGSGKENILFKLRGRGWFLSSGPNDMPGLILTRLKAWLTDEPNDFQRVKVEHFNFTRQDASNLLNKAARKPAKLRSRPAQKRN
jgi:hypothetical protein